MGLTGASSRVKAQIKFHLLTEQVVNNRLHEFGGSDFDRETRLRQLFAESGCSPEQVSEQPVKKKEPPNLICVLPGTSDEEILVGALFDHVKTGEGVVDNWSGASLLPSLVFSVKHEPRQHTYVFIAFMGEESGLVGSEYYASHLTKEHRAKVRAMINMDTLGLGPTEVWVSHSDDRLLRLLDVVAQSLHAPLRGVNVEKVGTTDSESFAHYKIPRITLHSVTQETLPILHTSKDSFDKIKMSDYYESYHLIAGYLIALEKMPNQTASRRSFLDSRRKRSWNLPSSAEQSRDSHREHGHFQSHRPHVKRVELDSSWIGRRHRVNVAELGAQRGHLRRDAKLRHSSEQEHQDDQDVPDGKRLGCSSRQARKQHRTPEKNDAGEKAHPV